MPTTLSCLTNPRVSPFWLIAALLTLLVGATVYAAPPTQGGGNFFDLTVTPIEDDQVVSANTISVLMLTAHTDGTLNGTVSSEVTCEVETVTQQGICHGMATFEGEVEGAKGTLLIDNVFRVDGPNFEAESFTILSGTDELASLQGEGTFSGSFDTAAGTYTMAFHFHPKGGEIETRDHQSGHGCYLLRPYAWYGLNVSCVEGPTTHINLAEGQVYRAVAIPRNGITGEGYAYVSCINGTLNFDGPKFCRRVLGGGFEP